MSAFARGPKERPLRLVVDRDSFASGELAELLGFGENPNVEIREILLSQIEFDPDGHASLRTDTGWSAIRSAAWNIGVAEMHGAHIDLDLDPFLRERMALAMYAERHQCDALVTASALLLQLARQFTPGANAVSLGEAFGVLGLHLRLREDFVVRQQAGFRERTDGADFYAALAQTMLTEWWRWSALCPIGESALSPSAGGLAHAVMARLARALRARDRLHGQLFREATETSIDEALFYFDAFLVAIMGAFDAAARVIVKAYSLRTNQRPSWRREKWRNELIGADAGFVDAMSDDTAIRATIDGISALRNLVHDEPLKVIGILGSGYRIAEYRAAVPDAERRSLLRAVAVLGGPEHWGFDEVDGESPSLDLGRFAEVALPAAVASLNEVMRLTAVERFGVQASPPFEPTPAITADGRLLRLLGGV